MRMKVRTVAVIGAGTMGSGIAQICAQSGWETRIFDAFPESLEKGIGRIFEFWDKGIEKGKTELTVFPDKIGYQLRFKRLKFRASFLLWLWHLHQ